MADPLFGIGWFGRRVRIQNRVQARLAVRSHAATRFLVAPEPFLIGSPARGAQLLAGNFAFAGQVVAAPGRTVWTILPPDAAFAEAVQGFGWLDDLAALSDPAAAVAARAWTADWIARFGAGTGPGWSPAVAGRRLLRWINHGAMLLGEEDDAQPVFLEALAQQVRFVARSHASAPPGLPRIEALTALVLAGQMLEGMHPASLPAVPVLARHAAEVVGPDGGLPSRNPEEVMAVFVLLTLAENALDQGNQSAGPELRAILARMARMLRGLRHTDGRLARFHGGGPGAKGRLDQALALAGVRGQPGAGLQMGLARLSCGRTSVFVDAAPPASGSATAHASTLALELCSGRRPVIVNCGSGAPFGADWCLAGRETASHSTLCLDGQSSSRLVAARGGAVIGDAPQQVTMQQAAGPAGHSLIVGHDGYLASHGLTHVRRLNLSGDGRALVGEDTLAALTEADRKRMGRVLGRKRAGMVPFAIRFHLHPDVRPLSDPANGTIHLSLPSGEVWQFRQHGGADMTLEESVYLDEFRLKPRSTKQIVLSGSVIDYAAQVSWTLAKSRETPQGLRDLEPVARMMQD